MKKLLFLLPLMILLAVSITVEAKEVKYPNGDYYNGGWKKGQPNGIGKMIYVNGDTYEGNWKDGEQDGFGKMTYDYGDIYEGNWKDGEPNGIGKMQYANGCIYEGEWVTGEAIGQGKCTDKFKNIFEGHFEKDRPRTGKLILKDGGYSEGEFLSSSIINYIVSLSESCKLYNGICEKLVQYEEHFTGKILNGNYDEGRLTLSNGEWFEGKWIDGKFYNGTCSNYIQNNERFTGMILNGKYGEGKLTLPKGEWYEGKWTDGIFSDGKCYAKIGDSYYQGELKDGMFYNGKYKGEFKNNYYDGIWTNGVFQGKCKLIFSNNKEGFQTFDGIMSEGDTMDGTVEYADGIIYRGVLKNKKKEGHGILYTTTRNIAMEGEWKEGNFIQGTGELYMDTGNTYPFTINKSNDTYNIKIKTDKGIITCGHKIGLDNHSVFLKITDISSDIRNKKKEEELKKQEEQKREDERKKEEEKKKEELRALQKEIADAKYYYWTPSEILRLYQENPAKFDDTFYGSFLGDATLIRGKIANIRREIESGLFGDDIYYNIYLEGGVVIQTHKKSVVSQIQKGQTVFMLAKYKNQTTNKYGYTQSPIFRLVTDEFIANSIDAVSKYLKEKRDTGEKVYENYYFRNLVRNIYR